MANPVTPNAPITEQASLKRRRLADKAWENGFESEVQRFHTGCLNARTCLDTPFPSKDELESEGARLKSDEAAMAEVGECVSKARRILYNLQGSDGTRSKHWDFATEGEDSGRVSLRSNFYVHQQFLDAMEFMEKAFVHIQNARSATQLDAAKQKTLEWVAAHREQVGERALREVQLQDPPETAALERPTSAAPEPC